MNRRSHWRRRTRIRAASFLTAAFAVVLGFAVQNHMRAQQYQYLLDTGYRHAFAELATAAGELDTALQKASYATTPALFSSLCTQAYGKALSAQMALGELPYGNVELEQTAAFLAKAGDYAMALSRGAYDAQTCTQEERSGLHALAQTASTLADALQSLQSDLDGRTVTLEDLEAVRSRLSGVSGASAPVTAGSAFQTVEADFPEVPALVYDGPFSEHLSNRTPKCLEGLPLAGPG